MKKTKILHVMGNMNGGGVESIVLNYYKYIDKDKFQFDFLCNLNSKYIPYREIEKLGGKIILVPPYKSFFKYLKTLNKVFKNNDYKIIHSHINTLSVIPLKIAKKHNIPIRISHNHSTTNKKEFKKHLLKQFLKQFSKKYATNYFACSKLAGDYLFKNNYYILNNAIELDKFKYNEIIREEYRNKLNINEDTLVIGHIGRFVKQKNHSFLIDIFKNIHDKNNNSILLLIGDGNLINNIKEKVVKLKLENNVKFLGQRNDIENLYQVMDILLLPSLYEGLPVVGIEALASNLLCFMSDSITKEINVLNNITFISLNKTSQEWANIILNKIKGNKRYDNVDILTKKGFYIKKEVKKLEKKYLELLTNYKKKQ